ncbi:MAG: cell division regulator GpsB [Mollicutes bacterium]|nr:cell division regulator GpsB [Mollicutes bacterium]
MLQDRIVLTVKDILDKEFKIDTRGFRPQEVDKFLDIIIRDYEEFMKIIQELEEEKKELIEDNIRLKQEIRNLKMKLEVIRETPTVEVNNADLLSRLSKLEKIVYGRDDYGRKE